MTAPEDQQGAARGPRPSAAPAACSEPAAARDAGGHVAQIFAALSHRDFRLLWLGAFASTIGTWVQKAAQSWLVLTITGSAFYLGLDSFLGELPILLFTLIGGVIADRYNRRHLLLGSQWIQMSCAFALMALVYLDVVRIGHVLALSFVAGTAQAFGGPAYQSLIPQLVPTRHLPNAIALNSIQFNLARVIGPLLAGAALATLGSALCFGLNGVSFLFVIAAIMALHVRHQRATSERRLVEDLKIGLRYVRGERPLIALTSLAFCSTFLGGALLTFLPIFAKQIFGQDVGAFTVLLAFSGSGAVCGALVVAWAGRFAGMGRTLLILQVAFGILMMLFAASRVMWVSHALLFFAGAAMIGVFSLLTSLVQLIAPNEMRGRVMSIYMVAFRGGSPLGALLSGYLASLTSAPVVLAANGGLLVMVAVYVLLRRRSIMQL